MKKVKIILINIFIFICLFFIIENIIYFSNQKNNFANIKFEHDIGQYETNYDLKDFFNGKTNDGSSGRKPDGLEFVKKKPILLFGCSYTHGQYLNYNQTMSYKLANLLQRPVYNRAVPGGSFQHMYYQSISEDLYNNIKPPYPDIVIYTLINDHFRRMTGIPFQIYDDVFFLHFRLKKNKFIIDNKNNKVLRFIRSLYTYRYIKSYFIDNIYLKKYPDKITNEVLQYFIQTRNNLESKFNKKISFYIIFFEDIIYKDLLKQKLEENGFNVLILNELTNEEYDDPSNPKYYMTDNGHPNEHTWNILVPIIAKEIGYLK